MVSKETLLHLQEKIDAAVTHATRSKVKEMELGTLRVTIYERRRGSWVKVQTPHTTDPIRGKVHDIIYSYDPASGKTERVTLGKLAKNPEMSVITKNPKNRHQNVEDGIYYPKRDE